MLLRSAAVVFGVLLLAVVALGPLRPLFSAGAHALGYHPTPPPAAPGKPLPPMHLTTLDGGPADPPMRGTVVYNVFTSWCPSCNQELPDLLRAQTRLSARGVQFIGIDQGERPSSVEAFIAAKDIHYPVWLDSSRATTTLLGARMIPETVIVHDGTVARIIVGPTTANELEAAVAGV